MGNGLSSDYGTVMASDKKGGRSDFVIKPFDEGQNVKVNVKVDPPAEEPPAPENPPPVEEQQQTGGAKAKKKAPSKAKKSSKKPAKKQPGFLENLFKMDKKKPAAAKKPVAAEKKGNLLENKTIDDLIKRARALKIEGRSAMNKSQLVKAIRSKNNRL